VLATNNHCIKVIFPKSFGPTEAFEEAGVFWTLVSFVQPASSRIFFELGQIIFEAKHTKRILHSSLTTDHLAPSSKPPTIVCYPRLLSSSKLLRRNQTKLENRNNTLAELFQAQKEKRRKENTLPHTHTLNTFAIASWFFVK
jgi:hypothetical protein